MNLDQLRDAIDRPEQHIWVVGHRLVDARLALDEIAAAIVPQKISRTAGRYELRYSNGTVIRIASQFTLDHSFRGYLAHLVLTLPGVDQDEVFECARPAMITTDGRLELLELPSDLRRREAAIHAERAERRSSDG